MISGFPDLLIEPLVKAALQEDLGLAGDVTAAAVIDPEARFVCAFVARADGVVAGLEAARLSMRLMDPDVRFDVLLADGLRVKAGDIIARVEGKARAILAAERVALNLLSHLSGIATLTAHYVAKVADLPVRIACTRKTTPLLRVLEKHAVRCGGGFNHRYGLNDAILIKDNHIAICGGVAQAMQAAKAHASHTMKIEIEVDSLIQLQQALPFGPDIILLDNFTIEALGEAVMIAKGQAILEASGGIKLETVRAMAETGVDILSIGALTHSSHILDIGLDAI
jgi:nicotinate-nucleotide pyrophosphorylase (carboxylating)